MKTLIITPEGLVIDNETTAAPEQIHLVMPSGSVYNIDDVVEIMGVHDEKANKKKHFKFVRRGKNFIAAVRKAMDEMDNLPEERTAGRVNEPTTPVQQQ